MAKKYKVRTKAVFNGQPSGSIIELNEETAIKYEELNYLEIISEVKPKPKTKKKSESKSKKEDK